MLIYTLRKESLYRTSQTLIGSRNAVNNCLTFKLFYIHTPRVHFGHMNAFLILILFIIRTNILRNIFVY